MRREPRAMRVAGMRVAGVMSGTSADGIDVAVVRIAPGKQAGEPPRVKLLQHQAFPYTAEIREAVLRAMAGDLTLRETARLHWRLGEVYAECLTATLAGAERVALVGLHGQTVFHQPGLEPFAGGEVRGTWQLGEPAEVAQRTGLPVVHDFRPADMAAGGQGAPLVPMLDFCTFRHAKKNRVLLNLGGIANVTAIPAGGGLGDVLAFDTGPANCVVDALMEQMYGRAFDCGGQTAARGQVLENVLAEALEHPFFAAAPPKSCGREQFGQVFARHFGERCVAAGGKRTDAVATALELTARSVLDAYGRFCWTHLGTRAPLARTEVIAAGGGVRNAALMRRLRDGFAALGVQVKAADELGMPAEAKEAAAFALLAWLSWHWLPGNVPSATGARGAVVLGKVTCG